MKLVLIAAFTLVALSGCHKADAADSHEPAVESGCTSVSEVKKFKQQYCPNEYPLFQGYYADKDGNNAWCRKIVSVCKEEGK